MFWLYQRTGLTPKLTNPPKERPGKPYPPSKPKRRPARKGSKAPKPLHA